MRNAIFACLLAGLLVLSGPASAYGQSKGKAKPKPKSTPVKSTAATAAKCTANGLTETEISELLAGHNNVRAELKLQPLVWDCALANMAQEWANKSIFEHRDTPLGENMFVAGDNAATVGLVIERWMAEKVNWTNSTGTCADGKVCTHYTQIVWKTTAKVGCGINRSANGKWKVVLVCNYDPGSRSSGPAY